MAIRKKIWQGWIGPKPMPEREVKWCAEMKRLNHDFEYECFGNEIMERYGRDPYVSEMMSRGSQFAFVMDRLRCLLLRDEGGIWLDPDGQPVRPLRQLDRVWDDPRITFVHAYRSGRRANVALHRGVTFADDTFLASAPNSRIINRVLEIWTPKAVEHNGHNIGIQVMDYSDSDVCALNYRYFYAVEPEPESLYLHDKWNLGSWTDSSPLRRNVALQK